MVILAAPHEITIFEINDDSRVSDNFTLLNSGFLNFGTGDILIIPHTVGRCSV